MLAHLLQTLRGERDVEDVAKAIGKSRSVIYLWESTEEPNARTGKPKHKRLPEIDNLETLLDYYGATDAQRNEARALLAQEKRLARLAKPIASDDPDPSDSCASLPPDQHGFDGPDTELMPGGSRRPLTAA